MRRLTRVGILLLITGISFLSVTFIRSASTVSHNNSFMTIPPKSWIIITSMGSYFLPPQEIRLSIEANSTIDVYILNSEGSKLWEENGEIKSIGEFKNIKQGIFYLRIDKRGEHEILVYNHSNSSTSGKIITTIYGLETDLLYFSSAVTALGLIVLLVSLIRKKAKNT